MRPFGHCETFTGRVLRNLGDGYDLAQLKNVEIRKLLLKNKLT